MPAGGSTGATAAPIRPVTVLDAAVLVPPGLRDLLLSCAEAEAFRPVWQSEIEAEVRRNGARLIIERTGVSPGDAEAEIDRTIRLMNAAFPGAQLPTQDWVPLVPRMTNQAMDRHVLAAAVGAGATHVVTNNLRDFPASSRPPGVTVQSADSFLLERLASIPDLVVAGVEAMASRHRKPPRTPKELAEMMAEGEQLRRFGAALGKVL